MKKILLADDSLTIQKVVELTFMDEDYDVEAVGSGDAVLGHLEGAQPDILIADIHMPGISGYELCRRAKSRYPEMPVLLLVGTFETLDEGELARSGADRHLQKPFDSQELLRLVEELTGAERPAAPAGEPTVPGFESTAHATPPAPAPPVAAVEAASAPEPPAPPAATVGELSDELVERIARRVVELLGDGVLREVAWEVVPDVAEVVVRERLRELEAQVD